MRDIDITELSGFDPTSTPQFSDASNPSTAPTSGCATPAHMGAALPKCSRENPNLALLGILDAVIEVAEAAGTMISKVSPSVCTSDTKNNSSDRVTETDKAVEAMIQGFLKKKFPLIHFLGEETFKGDKLTDELTFICDPIDGTLNFIHGFPNTAVSIALTENKKPILGVVLNPFRKDLYYAAKGYGAYLKKADRSTHRLPLRCVPDSRLPLPLGSLNDCLVAIEWGNQRQGPNWQLRSSVAMQLLTGKAEGGAMVHSIRSNGSAALDLCYVAEGSIDAYWEAGVWLWDVAAGWIILEEAGGMMASANPGDFHPTLEGRLYFGVREAKREEQERVVKELWGLMEGRKFVF